MTSRNRARKSFCMSSALWSSSSDFNEKILSPRPVIVSVDREQSASLVKVVLPASITLKAYQDSCNIFSKEAVRMSSKAKEVSEEEVLSREAVEKIFGADKIKHFSLYLLQDAINIECNRTGLPVVGVGKIVDLKLDSFVPGENCELVVECNLLPTVSYSREGAYKSLPIRVQSEVLFKQTNVDNMKRRIREQFRQFIHNAEHEAKEGDAVNVDIRGVLLNEDGSQGEVIDSVTAKDMSIVLDVNRTYHVIVSSLLGCKVGQRICPTIDFPSNASGSAALLAGKRVFFDIKVEGISALPDWNNALARCVSESLTASEMDRQIAEEVDRNAAVGMKAQRDEKLSEALLLVANTSRIPEAMREEAMAAQYSDHIDKLRSSGMNESIIADLLTEKRYAEFKAVNSQSCLNAVKLAVILEDIARREQIQPQKQEVDAAVSNAVKELEKNIDADKVDVNVEAVRQDLEQTLLRVAVLDFLAKHAVINVVE